MDIGTFLVQRVILHEIPQVKIADKAEHSPGLADMETELDDTKKRYFQQRIRRSLQNGYAVERDADQTGPVPGLLLEHFKADGADAFVRISRDIATHLHASQGGGSPKGLVAVIEGTVMAGKDAGKVRGHPEAGDGAGCAHRGEDGEGEGEVRGHARGRHAH